MDNEVNGPFRLSVPSRKGEVLSVSADGNIFYNLPDQGADDSWTFEIPNTGFYTEGSYLVSSLHRLAIDYKQDCGECLSASPVTLQSNHTLWYVSPQSEIYTIDPNGEKRYLWSILDSVYVTPDEHLAERWTAVSMEGFDVGLSKPQNNTNNHWILILAIVVMLVCLIYLLIKRK